MLLAVVLQSRPLDKVTFAFRFTTLIAWTQRHADGLRRICEPSGAPSGARAMSACLVCQRLLATCLELRAPSFDALLKLGPVLGTSFSS